MPGTVRYGLSLPADMNDALKQESEKTGAPVSALMRLAVEEFLEKRGYDVSSSLKWGGHRERDREKGEADG